MASRVIRKVRQLFDVDADSIVDGETLVWDDGTDTFIPGSGASAPDSADYLVGTAQAGLSAEIVVGASPGGELGGTWASPTVDATHSGSTHAAVQADAEATAAAALSAHVTDTADAHDASAISVDSTTLVGAGADVQAVLEELDDAIAAAGAPATADYLVGTSNGGLSAEIVVGTSPGGELGGTWASPTVDATHSGSSHAAVQAAAEATAAAALTAHTADTADAHDASAISSVAAGNLSATDVQAALNELDTEKAASASAVMDGDAAGGVLANTYPNPTFAVDMATQAELDAAAAAAVPKALFDANTVLKADSDNTPAALTMGASTTLARLASGNIVAATATEMRTLLDVPTTGEAVLDTLYDANTVLAADADNTPAAVTMGASTVLARLAAGNIVAATPAQIVTLLQPPGTELAYAQITTSATTTQTARASATTILTAPSVTFDGSTIVLVHFFTPAAGHSVDASLVFFILWEDSTDLNWIGTIRSASANATQHSVSGFFRYTPTAGAKVLTIRMFVGTAGTGTATAGTGASAGTAPAFIRITKV